MKQILFPILCLVLILSSCANNNSAPTTKAPEVEQVVADSLGNIVKVGDIAPDFEFTLTDGSTAKLSDYRGKVVMLQFTASWCGICKREMPYIESDIWQKHKDNPNFVLVGIDRDEPLETVIEFGKSVNITYPLALDPGATRAVATEHDGKCSDYTNDSCHSDTGECKTSLTFFEEIP
ncbi:MAG: redoxin family protein, partial [Bacteroidales bacterium]|nr:redoxin family protein [Bacteroidales bacterium]